MYMYNVYVHVHVHGTVQYVLWVCKNNEFSFYFFKIIKIYKKDKWDTVDVIITEPNSRVHYSDDNKNIGNTAYTCTCTYMLCLLIAVPYCTLYMYMCTVCT